ncbi:hypothetical protein PENTCL1PPCAC_26911 [Pristionchus entomophagus]|uniref:Amine oxidase domain-containing protein n=1 Tax=Pristionchus entomophagus TaxID=358040 RepID=A0AAV5UEH3_9BILA|nr:hypothetical protein PENTCL1PPCAC_26911 [Pristionchus entomophagus]
MSNNNRLSVCIIGGGVAGLSAARVLQKADVPFVVVEGSKRIGGRIFSFQHKGGFLQHGATFVNGDRNEIYRIAKREGLIKDVVGDFDLYRDFSDVRMEEDDLTMEDKAAFTAFTKDLEEKYENLAERNPHLTVREAFDEDYKHFIEECPSRSSRLHSFNSLSRLYLSYYEMEWAANTNQMALGNFTQWDDESETSDESFSLNSIGYKRILDELAGSIPDALIRLETTVRNINYENQESVFVNFADGTSEEFSSVIVTSSLGFLKAHAAKFFVPPLHDEKMRAIEAIGFGDMQKLFLEYDKPFWSEDEDSIKTIGLSSSPLLGRGNLFEVVKWDRKTLTLWLSGSAVEYAGMKTDEELKIEITEHLRKSLNNDSLEFPTRVMRHGWRNDPLILGSYSYLTPSSIQMGDANAILANPIHSHDGRPLVCFAGEATHSSFYQTTCGAFLSGEREAKKLVDNIT